MEEQTIVEDSPESRGGWARGEKLLLAAVILFALCVFLLGLTEIQIQSRERRLDQLENAVNNIEDDAEAIRRVADQANGGNSEVQEAFAQLIRDVAAIRQAVCGGPCPTPEE